MERLPHDEAAVDGAMNYGSLEPRNGNVYDLMLALLLMGVTHWVKSNRWMALASMAATNASSHCEAMDFGG